MDVYFTQAQLANYVREVPLKQPASAELLTDLVEGLVAPCLGAKPELAVDVRVKAIALEATARAYRNPEGYVDEAIDDWRGRRPESLARAGVFLTDAERSDLNALVETGAAGSRARSVKLVADSTAPNPYRLPTP